MQIEVLMKRFGSIRHKTIHEKIKMEDGWHFKCEHLHCSHNNNGICKCILLDYGNNYLNFSEDRGKIRSKTYIGIAKAMANQWSKGWF